MYKNSLCLLFVFCTSPVWGQGLQCSEAFSSHLWARVEMDLFLFQQGYNRPLKDLTQFQKRRIVLTMFGRSWKQMESDYISGYERNLDSSYWLMTYLNRGYRFKTDAQIAELLISPNRVGLWQAIRHQLAWEVSVLQAAQGKSQWKDILVESLNKRMDHLLELQNSDPGRFDNRRTRLLMFRTQALLFMLEQGRPLDRRELFELARLQGLGPDALVQVRAAQVGLALMPDLKPTTIVEIAVVSFLAWILNEINQDKKKPIRFNDMIVSD